VADWVNGAVAVSACASAAGVISGGVWALYHFTREEPYAARSNVSLEAELLPRGAVDFARVEVSASAIGKAKLQFNDSLRPLVAIYAVTESEALEPPSWGEIEPLVAFPCLASDSLIESGETLGDAAFICIGERDPATIAYRVEFLLPTQLPGHEELCAWQAVQIIPLVPAQETVDLPPDSQPNTLEE
jgi:hypothetical protein